MSVGTRRAALSLYKEALRVCSRFDDPMVKRKVALACALEENMRTNVTDLIANNKEEKDERRIQMLIDDGRYMRAVIIG